MTFVPVPDTPDAEEIPKITEMNELQTFVSSKKNKFWLRTVINKWRLGLIA